MTVVRTKSAALHYETLVASHASTGSDVGEIGHGQKQFIAILRAAEVWCDRQIAIFLSTPLPSTKLPPHFYVTADKSTPNRISNQAVMICSMVAGRQKAIAVSAPEVYEPAESGIDGDVSGAHAPELATTIYQNVKDVYSTIQDSSLQGAWMGTVCDGAYATAPDDETFNTYYLGNLYSLTFGSEKPIHAELNEPAVYSSIYCNEEIYSAIGIESCVAIDIALAKGGTEAVVESLYSVMKSQQSTGGQSNETLALR